MNHILLILFLLYTQCLYSQDARNSIGIRSGVLFSINGNSNYESMIGPNIGIFYSRHIKNFNISIEPSYNTRGAKGGLEGETKYQYLDLPTTIGYTSSGKLIYGGNIGFSIAYARAIDGFSPPGGFIAKDILLGATLGYRLSEKYYLTMLLRYGYAIKSIDYFSPIVFVGYNF